LMTRNQLVNAMHVTTVTNVLMIGPTPSLLDIISL
jgi:hypothetical protein